MQYSKCGDMSAWHLMPYHFSHSLSIFSRSLQYLCTALTLPTQHQKSLHQSFLFQLSTQITRAFLRHLGWLGLRKEWGLFERHHQGFSLNQVLLWIFRTKNLSILAFCLVLHKVFYCGSLQREIFGCFCLEYFYKRIYIPVLSSGLYFKSFHLIYHSECLFLKTRIFSAL